MGDPRVRKTKDSDAVANLRARVRTFVTAFIFGLLTSAAYAKDFPPAPNAFPEPKVDEQAYRDSLKRIPDQKPNSDPWGSVRDTLEDKNNKNKK